jgi:hypothetical protein
MGAVGGGGGTSSSNEWGPGVVPVAQMIEGWVRSMSSSAEMRGGVQVPLLKSVLRIRSDPFLWVSRNRDP